jgi:hypothetical protein
MKPPLPKNTKIPGQIQLYVQRTFVERRLGEFENYTIAMEGMLRAEAGAHENRIKATLEEMTEEQRANYLEHVGEELAELHETFPIMFRASVFAMLVSDMERWLYTLAKTVGQLKKLKIAVKDLGGSGWERSRLYLRKAALVEFPDTTDEWKEMQVFVLLRNHIIHNQAQLVNGHRDEKPLRGYAAKHPNWINIEPNGNISLQKSFLLHAQGVYHDFFVPLFDQLRKSPDFKE